MLKRLGILLVLLVLTFAIGYCDGADQRTPPDTKRADSLARANDSLTLQYAELMGEAAHLAFERDTLLEGIVVLKNASDSATKDIRKNRDSLPEPGTLDSSSLEAAYRDALDQLDESIAELDRKDAIILLDAAAIRKGIAREASLLAQIENQKEQVRNAELQSKFWKAEYEKASKPRCGKKCGIVLGVLGTIVTAIGIDQVLEVTK